MKCWQTKKKVQLKFKQKIIAPAQQRVGIFEEETGEDGKMNEEDDVK